MSAGDVLAALRRRPERSTEAAGDPGACGPPWTLHVAPTDGAVLVDLHVDGERAGFARIPAAALEATELVGQLVADLLPAADRDRHDWLVSVVVGTSRDRESISFCGMRGERVVSSGTRPRSDYDEAESLSALARDLEGVRRVGAT